MTQKTYNDLVFAVAKRAKELSDMTMPMLRMGAGTADTEGDTTSLLRPSILL
jgi:hypothetical protein